MKVYIAAPYAARNLLRPFARMVVEAGHEVTSSWLQAQHHIQPGVLDAAPEQTDEYTQQHVSQDFADIDDADVVMLMTSSWTRDTLGLTAAQTVSGGRHIETGYALAKSKFVIVVGDPENIFHRGACVNTPYFNGALRLLDVVSADA